MKAGKRPMIKKVVKIRHLRDPDLTREDLNYWCSKSPEERIAAVEYLRRQFYGNTARLQKIAPIIQRSQH